MSHEIGRQVKDLAVLLCIGSRGPLADTLLTTDRMQNAALRRRAAAASLTSSL